LTLSTVACSFPHHLAKSLALTLLCFTLSLPLSLAWSALPTNSDVVMIIDEKLIQQRRALPSAPTASPVTPVVSEKSRLAARHAVPLPDPLPLSPKRQALLQSAALANSRPPFAYNDTGTTVPSPPYSDRSSNTRTQSSYSSSSTTHPLIPSSQSQSQLHPTYPPLTPAYGAQPLHSVSKPSNGTITPNPLLFQARPGQAPQSSRPGDVTPNLLLLSNSPYARTQPSGMLGNVYPTAAPLAVPAGKPQLGSYSILSY
jgi:hypothetical protein